jgi:hypothetical protein
MNTGATHQYNVGLCYHGNHSSFWIVIQLLQLLFTALKVVGSLLSLVI